VPRGELWVADHPTRLDQHQEGDKSRGAAMLLLWPERVSVAKPGMVAMR
jgi:hypothetical protein